MLIIWDEATTWTPPQRQIYISRPVTIVTLSNFRTINGHGLSNFDYGNIVHCVNVYVSTHTNELTLYVHNSEQYCSQSHKPQGFSNFTNCDSIHTVWTAVRKKKDWSFKLQLIKRSSSLKWCNCLVMILYYHYVWCIIILFIVIISGIIYHTQKTVIVTGLYVNFSIVIIDCILVIQQKGSKRLQMN